MQNLIVAVLLSTSDPLTEKIDRIEVPILRDAAKTYWISMGVMEPTENRFQWDGSYESDVAAMVWRLHNVPEDAPHLDVRHTLPDADRCLQSIYFANAYTRWLQSAQEWALPGDEWNDIELLIEDTNRRRELWWKIWRCTGHYTGDQGRRYEMNELKRLIGAENFIECRWPDPVPPAAYTHTWWSNYEEYP